jgi:hypothetical protein
MDNPSPIAFTLVVLGAAMGFGREWFTKLYVWIFTRLRKEQPHPRLVAIMRLYLVFTGMIFTVMGILGLLGIVRL